jgi:hypothetical protein
LATGKIHSLRILAGRYLSEPSATRPKLERFQYESGADVRNDDGVVTNDSYPLTCEFSADIVKPLQVEVKPQTLKIGNESFYT